MPSVCLPLPFEAYKGAEPYLFVSYAHKDGCIVYPEIKALHERGFRIWYDEGIDPGNEWPEEVAIALNNAALFLVFVTGNATESQNVRNEIHFALNRKKPFLAVYLADVQLPDGLELLMGSIQAIMKWRMNINQYTQKLLTTIPHDICSKACTSPELSQLITSILPASTPFDLLLKDKEITTIYVNSWNSIYVERSFRREKVNVQFDSEEQLVSYTQQILRDICVGSPSSQTAFQGQLEDGSSVSAVLPLSGHGASLVICKSNTRVISVPELLHWGAINEDILDCLRAVVIARKNILVVGGAGCGLVAWLNVLSSLIPEDERVLVLRSTVNLALQHANTVALRSTDPGSGAAAFALMPDRIIIEELSRENTLSILQAANGCSGTSIFAGFRSDSLADALTRMRLYAQYSNPTLPLLAISTEIAMSLNVVIEVKRFEDGTRKVSRIAQLSADSAGEIEIMDLFSFSVKGMDDSGRIKGHFVATKLKDSWIQNLNTTDHLH